jgi:hypothetical protein
MEEVTGSIPVLPTSKNCLIQKPYKEGEKSEYQVLLCEEKTVFEILVDDNFTGNFPV